MRYFKLKNQKLRYSFIRELCVCVCVCVCVCTQSRTILCDPMDCSLPGSTIHIIFQARIWSGLLFPTLGDLPDPGIKPTSLALEVDSLPTLPSGKVPGEDYSAVKEMNSSYTQNG